MEEKANRIPTVNVNLSHNGKVETTEETDSIGYTTTDHADTSDSDDASEEYSEGEIRVDPREKELHEAFMNDTTYRRAHANAHKEVCGLIRKYKFWFSEDTVFIMENQMTIDIYHYWRGIAPRYHMDVIAVFCGEDPHFLEYWLKDLGDNFYRVRMVTEDQITEAARFLKGKANEWWNKFILDKPNKVRSGGLEYFKRVLRTQYGVANTFMYSRQAMIPYHFSVRIYTHHFRKMLSRHAELQKGEDWAIEYVKGLPHHLGRQVSLSRPVNWHMASRMALEYETAYNIGEPFGLFAYTWDPKA